jgi:hypothetical protein
MPRVAPSRTRKGMWHDTSPPFASQQNKKGTLLKSPPKSHLAPNFRETPLGGGQAWEKTAAFP